MLPFTLDIYFAAVAQFGQTIWPVPLATHALGAAALLCAFAGRQAGLRVSLVILSAGWFTCGAGFHLYSFAAINFAAPAYAALFFVQAVLLAWFAGRQGMIDLSWRGGARGVYAVVIALGALLVWPPIGFFAGGGLPTGLFFGVDPTATVLLTLALLVLVEGRAAAWLLPIPVFWTLVDGATFYVL
ncbi:MAG: hypothetical protein JJ899_11150, partial [Alphaproteobacteria bacterium]|nr:hypothetical protein [Alphaproteobacteria bacterium]